MTDAPTTTTPDPKPSFEIKEALAAVEAARTTVSAAKASLTDAENSAKDILTGKEVLISGYTTHIFKPLDENEKKSIRLTQEVVTIKAVTIGEKLYNQPKDSILVVHRDGTEYLMLAFQTTIQTVPPDWPRDGSYFCKTIDCMKFVPPEEQAEHKHGCPVGEGMCGSRVCNVTGRCQG